MRSSSIISLFGETASPKRGPSSFVISLSVHTVAFVLLLLGLNQPKKADFTDVARRYTVRTMELHQPEPKIHQYVPREPAESGQTAKVRMAAPGNSAPTAPAQRIPINLLAQKQVVQTLVQPDVNNNLLIQKEVPLPQVTVWSSRDMTVRTMVPASQQTEAKIEVQPSLEPPNQAVRIADVRIAPGPSETKAPLPEPSKTSPVTAQGPAPAQKVPETASSRASGQPSSGSVISMSDVQMKEGTATLPMVNQVAPNTQTGSLSQGQPKSTSPTGSGAVENKQNGASAGQTPGQIAANKAGSGVGLGNSTLGNTVGTEGADTAGGMRSLTHLSMPRDGTFGMVVVGTSAADEYPEAANTWSGKLAYTVYLHLGTRKNWIMQYSVPRTQDIARAGTPARPEAPWPFDITRPSIDSDTGADAIIVHGYVNATGHFERLAVVFPTELAEAKFLLHALQQWQFRPAMQNGKETLVEVLLIIPDDTE